MPSKNRQLVRFQVNETQGQMLSQHDTRLHDLVARSADLPHSPNSLRVFLSEAGRVGGGGLRDARRKLLALYVRDRSESADARLYTATTQGVYEAASVVVVLGDKSFNLPSEGGKLTDALSAAFRSGHRHDPLRSFATEVWEREGVSVTLPLSAWVTGRWSTALAPDRAHGIALLLPGTRFQLRVVVHEGSGDEPELRLHTPNVSPRNRELIEGRFATGLREFRAARSLPFDGVRRIDVHCDWWGRGLSASSTAAVGIVRALDAAGLLRGRVSRQELANAIHQWWWTNTMITSTTRSGPPIGPSNNRYPACLYDAVNEHDLDSGRTLTEPRLLHFEARAARSAVPMDPPPALQLFLIDAWDEPSIVQRRIDGVYGEFAQNDLPVEGLGNVLGALTDTLRGGLKRRTERWLSAMNSTFTQYAAWDLLSTDGYRVGAAVRKRYNRHAVVAGIAPSSGGPGGVLLLGLHPNTTFDEHWKHECELDGRVHPLGQLRASEDAWLRIAGEGQHAGARRAVRDGNTRTAKR